jgi:hypothetical protein
MSIETIINSWDVSNGFKQHRHNAPKGCFDKIAAEFPKGVKCARGSDRRVCWDPWVITGLQTPHPLVAPPERTLGVNRFVKG